jgi:hypothetical protein
MGYYIETPQDKHKAQQLHELYHAELVLSPETFDFNGPDALICVVENVGFDAAAIAYDAKERDDFLDPNDDRPKVWLKMPKTRVHLLNPRCPIPPQTIRE